MKVFVRLISAIMLLLSLTACADLLPYVPGFRPQTVPVEDFSGTVELRSWHGRSVYTLRTPQGPVFRLEAAVDLSPFVARVVHLRGSRFPVPIDPSVSHLYAQLRSTGTVPDAEYWKVVRVRVVSRPKLIDHSPPPA